MFGIGDIAGFLFGGAKAGWDRIQNKDGDQAAQDAMTQARDQIGQLRAQQHAQRQADLQRAMGYFQPTNTLLNKMYGTAMPAPYQTDANTAGTRGVTTARGRFSSGQTPDTTPVRSGAAAMFGAPPAPSDGATTDYFAGAPSNPAELIQWLKQKGGGG